VIASDRLHIGLRGPIVLLILAATAIPVEIRPLGHATLDFKIFPADFAANVIGYMPVGLVLAASGCLRSVLGAALISTTAEVGQLVMMHRDPSAADILANTIGAALGAGVSARWRIGLPELRLNRLMGLAAAFAACTILLWANILAPDRINTRGFTSPGTLEAHWRFDEVDQSTAVDSSAHGLNGSFRKPAKRVPGVLGGAVELDGASDSIDVDVSTALRLAGSMTITAWINPSIFPQDDAAVVSQLGRDSGYQLDTTVDQGPRTIGFKLTNAYGDFVARYGATPLTLNAWHHIAGVYNGPGRTLDVYLDGRLDNGPLVGAVTSQQRSSRAGVSIGRRNNEAGYEFAGTVDDVRIYSRPLTQAEIGAVMKGAKLQDGDGHDQELPEVARSRMSDSQDIRLPLVAAALGMLTTIAILGLRRSARRATCLLVSLSAGVLLLPTVSAYLPLFNLWLIPFVSLAGGASVALTIRRSPDGGSEALEPSDRSRRSAQARRLATACRDAGTGRRA
jgi:hypothetical protein